ncbi:sulfur carrier protein ThiS [Parvularcula sp. LCG005]|uniref:sulfur carrier protein ThiS n=1 Tax=Parvularcula sp. LCG005 TaxID=3078805 RepID=UPI002943AB9E|nr:sulfur carrier protein ThiS [Parvularcula sp. LCG005]WOI52113.1 sulfur carrier protein ThiS [Parvularcula sp. LCG005]
MVEIILNGEGTTVEAATVLGLLEVMELPVTKIAVEHNLAIVPKSAFASTAIADGDRIEIVQFVGGG